MSDKIVTVVEIDIDQCSLTWGVSPCLAAFSTSVVRKCYNSFETCAYKSAYTKGVNTLKFCSDGFPLVGQNYIPALKNVGGYEQQVNIAGFSPDIGGIGKRASVNVTFSDFPYSDVLTDKYWAERITGAAQTDEAGYKPLDRGSFWSKFKARNPNYAGRPLRVIVGRMDAAGQFVADVTRYYVMDRIEGPNRRGDITIVAKDALSLADNKKAQAPRLTEGRLLNDIDAGQTSLVLTPAGVGNLSYPASGFVTVGAEIMRFTRSGDSMALSRGQFGTVRTAHTNGDSVQLAYNVSLARGDTVIRDLLVNYAGLPAAWIPFAEWQAEFDRWGSQFLLTATICKPTGVTELLAEICRLGVSIWWDEVARLVRIRINRPEEEPIQTISDRNNIISITSEDNDDKRATRIELWTVQLDPTKDLGKENFIRSYITVSVDSERPDMFGSSRTETIFTRWLNHGPDGFAKVLIGRLLNRYKRAPVTYTITLDKKDDMDLADVISLESSAATDVTGRVTPKLNQVYSRKDDKLGATVIIEVQQFQFDARYGVITENTRPSYNASTPAQRIKGTYIVGPSLQFSDGTGPYQLA